MLTLNFTEKNRIIRDDYASHLQKTGLQLETYALLGKGSLLSTINASTMLLILHLPPPQRTFFLNSFSLTHTQTHTWVHTQVSMFPPLYKLFYFITQHDQVSPIKKKCLPRAIFLLVSLYLGNEK